MKTPSGTSIALRPDGFMMAGSVFVSWDEVIEIIVYKEDWWTTDEICLGFRRGGEDGFDRVNESTEGYDQLLAILPGAFPGIRTDWFSTVAFPAFEENWTVLWRKETIGCQPA